MRRSIIAADDDLYGIEKEELIDRLSKEMWGEEADQLETGLEPYRRYGQKINLYSKDLSEANEEEKGEMIIEYRKSFFPEEIVERFEIRE